MYISNNEFQSMINRAFDSLPKEHRDNVRNVAILYEDDPSPEQRTKLQLRDDQTLFGLYEGIPLARRQGMHSQLPDKITLFKHSLEQASGDVRHLQENIRHTLWHEVAHYYGLNHTQIGKLES
jgi:predicted Zn-dependent protease with MMP-like domain